MTDENVPRQANQASDRRRANNQDHLGDQICRESNQHVASEYFEYGASRWPKPFPSENHHIDGKVSDVFEQPLNEPHQDVDTVNSTFEDIGGFQMRCNLQKALELTFGWPRMILRICIIG